MNKYKTKQQPAPLHLTGEQRERLIAWCEDLESGKYRQVRGALRDRVSDRYGYCCLGVACNTYKRETSKGDWNPDDCFVVPAPKNAPPTSDYMSYGELPRVVANWFGIESIPVLIDPKPDKGHGDRHGADAWNDDYGATFKKIARMIRHTYNLPPQTKGELK